MNIKENSKLEITAALDKMWSAAKIAVDKFNQSNQKINERA